MSASKTEHKEAHETGGSTSQPTASSSINPPTCPGTGDVFRTVGLPDKFMVGLDAVAMTTSKSLGGFRDIPPGPHFLWVQQPNGVSRCGYWFVTGTQRAVRVKEWDRYNESLVEPAAQPSDLESVYSTLKPYALHDRREGTHWSLGDPLPDWARAPARLWSVLTSAISLNALARITGKEGVDEVFVDSTDCVKDVRRDDEAPAADTSQADSVSNGLSFLFLQDFRDLQVLDLGGKSSRDEDTSTRINALLSNPARHGQITERDIIAEMQFTFLTGTHLGNAACLEQWWNLVLKILLRAYQAAIVRPRFSADIIRTLHAQLLYTEHYFGSSGPASDDKAGGNEDRETRRGPSSERPIFQYKPHNREKLRQSLVEYKRRVNTLLSAKGKSATPEHRAVAETFEELEAWLWRWNWDLRAEAAKGSTVDKGKKDDMPDSDEEEDEQPVVVELDEEGREVGLVSFQD